MNKKNFLRLKPFDEVDAQEMQNFMDSAIKDAISNIISPGILTGLNVITSSNLTLTVNSGRAYDSNYNPIIVTTNQNVTLDSADLSNPRIDVITIKYTSVTENNVDSANKYGYGTSFIYSQDVLDSFTIEIVKGIPSSSPTKPSIPSGNLELASVTISAGATSINSGNITDTRTFYTITDSRIGNRTINQNTAASDTATITDLFSGIANRIKAITGKSDWKTNPATTLENANTHINQSTGAHNASAISLIDSNNNTDTNNVEDAIAEIYSKVNEEQSISQSFTMGAQKITVDQATPLKITAKGQTRFNLVHGGDCEDINLWATGNSTRELNSTNKVYGNNSIKVIMSSTLNAYVEQHVITRINLTKYYILVAEVKSGDGTPVEIGMRLINGASAEVTSQSVTDTANFHTVYAKISPANMAGTTDARVRFNVRGTSAGQNGFFDGMRLYEITQTEYDAIDSLTTEQIAAKYPFVNGLQAVNGLYAIRKGKNLLPPFTEWHLSANSGAINIGSPYRVDFSATSTYTEMRTIISVIKGQQYNINCLGNAPLIIRVVNEDGSIGATIKGSGNPVPFTFIPTTNSIAVYLTNNSTNISYYAEKISLNLGPEALSFESQNDDYQFFTDLNLASSIDGSVYDSLYIDDNGEYRKLARFKVMDLDGSLEWAFHSDYTGYKQVRFPLSGALGVSSYSAVQNSWFTKYDGKPLDYAAVEYGPDRGVVWANGFAYISIADTDSGWGEDYTPTADEIKAYFWGWKMYDGGTNPNGDGVYNGGPNKNWAYRVNGGLYAGGTATLPTTQAPINEVWRLYRLQYQLANAVDEPVTVEGTISLHEGDNQVEVGVGVVVREPVEPRRASSTVYEINHVTKPLKGRTSKILNIYRGQEVDIRWKKYSNSNTAYWFGGGGADISIANYDPSVAYSVTYLALDAYALTCNPVSLSAEYKANLASVVSQNVQDIADLSTQVSVIKNNYARKQQGQWVAPTLLNGWVNFDSASEATVGYMKDELGFVSIKGTIKSGIMTGGTTLFILPLGYRPKGNQGAVVSCNDGTTGSFPAYLNIREDGRVNISQTVSGNASLVISNVRFRAEQ